MGSSPSYQVQDDTFKHHTTKPRRNYDYTKESTRTAKNKTNETPIEANPEQENQIKLPQAHEQMALSQKEMRSQKDPKLVLTNAAQPIHQSIPIETHSNKPSIEKMYYQQAELEAQNAIQTPAMSEKQMRRKDFNRGKEITHPHIEQVEEAPQVHEKPKGRHHFKPTTSIQLTQEHPINNTAVIKKPHRRSQEINYKEFDSAHIRHKAMQEVGQNEHHPHPIIARQPIYQHERLYPKILKTNNHHNASEEAHDNTPNRHFQHQHNYQQEVFEQPHKLHLYKRHIMHHHTQEHDDKMLQKSIEVRAQNQYLRDSFNPTPTPRTKINTLDVQTKRPKIKSLHNNQEEEPAKANFKRRKDSMPAQGERESKGLNKLQELQEKSIADINKENEFNITEYAAIPTELMTCRQGCGRKFQADRLQKHEAVCRKVFQQRRAAFDAQGHRIVSKEQKKLLQKGGKIEDKHHQKGIVPKWKAQSIALRAHIKMGMDSHYQPNEEEMEMLSEEHHIDIVSCPVCERKFNKNSAKTHIPFCKAQLDKQLERNRFEKPKTKR